MLANVPKSTPLGIRLRHWARRKSLEDLINCNGHSRDFSGSRADYINLRLRLLSLVFAAAALAWIPIDLIFLDEGAVRAMVVLRLLFSGGFLALALWRASPHSLRVARWRLVGLVLIPALFYVGSREVLGGDLTETGVLVGYTFLPYLMVVLAAIFPLTLREAVFYAVTVGATKVGTEFYFGTLFSIAALGDIWLLGLLMVIAVWASLAQLHMLLALYREATRDALTGLVNRRPLTRWLEKSTEQRQEHSRPLSLLLFDLDLFKKINDTHGHLAGDEVLARFAALLTEQLPEPELVGRWGGEEFLAALPGDDAEVAEQRAEQIRLACHTLTVEGPEGEKVRFTVSIGVAQLRPDESLSELLNRVDNGLYAAKASGRDMVVMA